MGASCGDACAYRCATVPGGVAIVLSDALACCTHLGSDELSVQGRALGAQKIFMRAADASGDGTRPTAVRRVDAEPGSDDHARAFPRTTPLSAKSSPRRRLRLSHRVRDIRDFLALNLKLHSRSNDALQPRDV